MSDCEFDPALLELANYVDFLRERHNQLCELLAAATENTPVSDPTQLFLDCRVSPYFDDITQEKK